MYGYFRPYDSELGNKHKRLFQAYYCRLCYCLWLVGGQTARFFTTFDLTLYSMILHLDLGVDAPPFLGCQRLRTSNRDTFKTDYLGMKLARLALISFGEKFRDDMLDEGGIKNFIKKFLFEKKVRAACLLEPEIARCAYEGTERINRMQDANAEIDALLSEYALVTEETISAVAPLSEPALRLFRALARWTYFVDILCDYDEDVKKDQYNPLRQEGICTVEEYFSANYHYLLLKNREISREVCDALKGCKKDRPEWDVLHKVLLHALNTVVPNILEGKDVSFHYFKELFRNRQRITEEKNNIKKRNAYGSR